MSIIFCIPAKPEDLLDEDCELEIKVLRCTEIGSLSQATTDDFVEGLNASEHVLTVFISEYLPLVRPSWGCCG